jgi:hypothetical protein
VNENQTTTTTSHHQGQRPARLGELCECGRPAEVVIETTKFGPIGWCGIGDGATPKDGTFGVSDPAVDLSAFTAQRRDHLHELADQVKAATATVRQLVERAQVELAEVNVDQDEAVSRAEAAGVIAPGFGGGGDELYGSLVHLSGSAVLGDALGELSCLADPDRTVAAVTRGQ